MHNIIIGETCLLSYQLRRLNIIQNENGLFDNVLINIEGVKLLIEDDFKDLLDEKYLKYLYYLYYPKHNIGHYKWINVKYTTDEDNIFSWPVFSFFHYDILNIDNKNSIQRKLDRFKSYLADDQKLNLFYYYRYSEKFNFEKVIEKINTLSDILNMKYNKKINVFLITKSEGDDDILYNKIHNIHHFNFISKFSWIGIDDNWNGSSDNHLFDSFLKLYNNLNL
jgi:hypothetical protein